MNDNERMREEDHDPAAEAFARLEREMALMRRAVEHLAAEKADIAIPDYTQTLGEMSQRLNWTHQSLKVIAAKPAMTLTPKNLAEHIDDAARAARRIDHEELRRAQDRYDYASRALNGVVATIRTADEQRQHLLWAAGGGILAGCLLWATLPGVILRALPDSWHGPEKMAAHIIGERSMWEAGTRLMSADKPKAWQAVIQAVELWRDNFETIAKCKQEVIDDRVAVRCAINFEA